MSEAIALCNPVAAATVAKMDKIAADKRETAGTGAESTEFAALLDAMAAVQAAPVQVPPLVLPVAAVAATSLPALPAADVELPRSGDDAANALETGTGVVSVAELALRAARTPAPVSAPVSAPAPALRLPLREAVAEAAPASADEAPVQAVLPQGASEHDGDVAFETAVIQAAKLPGFQTDRQSDAGATPAERPLPVTTAAGAPIAGAPPAQEPPLPLAAKLPVHHPRFGESVSQQVVVLVQHGIQHAQLSLNPPELGPLEVRVTVAYDEATIQIASHSGIVRDAVQEAMPRLRELMEQTGVRLGEAGVFAELPQRRSPEDAAQRADQSAADSPAARGGTAASEDEPAFALSRFGLIDAYV